jgi:hypothetical protein
MSMPQRHEETLRALCAQPDELDGLDPRRERRDAHATSQREKRSRKDVQFCGHVRELIDDALRARCGSDLLRRLACVDVAPAPHIGRLRVTVEIPGDVPVSAALRELERARGYLRTCIAESTSRKRVPELFFAPASPGVHPGEAHDE